LRAIGVDSRLVDPGGNKIYPAGFPKSDDRGVPVVSMDWATKADVLVNHSGYDGTAVDETDQPIIHVAHGRPINSFLSELEGSTPIYSWHYFKNSDPRIKSVVTFWPQYVDYMRVMYPDKPVEYVQAPVDLDKWTPGPKKYNFNGRGGDINVVCTDVNRADASLFLPLQAFCLWARGRVNAKFHLYAKPKSLKGYAPIIRRIQDDGNMGEILGWVEGLKHIYRAADLVLTGHDIDTRTVREAMACGCPVLRTPGLRADFSRALSQNREQVRSQAEYRFNPKVTAMQFKKILDNENCRKGNRWAE